MKLGDNTHVYAKIGMSYRYLGDATTPAQAMEAVMADVRKGCEADDYIWITAGVMRFYHSHGPGHCEWLAVGETGCCKEGG